MSDLEQVEATASSRRKVVYTAIGVAAFATVALLVVVSGGSSDKLRSVDTTKSTTSLIAAMGSSKTRVYYDALESEEKKTLFEDFKTQFGKAYTTDDEEATRYSNFQNFLKLIDSRNDDEQNKGKGTAVHGVTQFSDLSEEEMEKYLFGYKEKDQRRRQLKKGIKSKKAVIQEYTGTATAVDWADTYTTGVRDQGYCGSCWAYSSAEQLESDSIRNGYLTTSDKLSVQQMVSCDTVDLGCSGGNTETAYDYIYDAGGLELESDYPYVSYFDITGTCELSDSKNVFAVTLDKYYTLSSEDDMQTYVLSTGPLSICAAATSWTSYTSGVVSTCDDDVNHCVQVTGVDTDNEYWIIRNRFAFSSHLQSLFFPRLTPLLISLFSFPSSRSWGKSWGNSGYIYVKTGKNMCSISNDPTYTEPVKLDRRKR